MTAPDDPSPKRARIDSPPAAAPPLDVHPLILRFAEPEALAAWATTSRTGRDDVREETRRRLGGEYACLLPVARATAKNVPAPTPRHLRDARDSICCLCGRWWSGGFAPVWGVHAHPACVDPRLTDLSELSATHPVGRMLRVLPHDVREHRRRRGTAVLVWQADDGAVPAAWTLRHFERADATWRAEARDEAVARDAYRVSTAQHNFEEQRRKANARARARTAEDGAWFASFRTELREGGSRANLMASLPTYVREQFRDVRRYLTPAAAARLVAVVREFEVPTDYHVGALRYCRGDPGMLLRWAASPFTERAGICVLGDWSRPISWADKWLVDVVSADWRRVMPDDEARADLAAAFDVSSDRTASWALFKDARVDVRLRSAAACDHLGADVWRRTQFGGVAAVGFAARTWRAALRADPGRDRRALAGALRVVIRDWDSLRVEDTERLETALCASARPLEMLLRLLPRLQA